MEENRSQIVINQQLIRRALVGIATPTQEALDNYVASFNMWAHAFVSMLATSEWQCILHRQFLRVRI